MSDTRTIKCIKYAQDLPGLAKPPFPGPLGKEIFEKVSAQAWSEWKDHMQIKVLNEYRLNMSDPKDYAVLMEQMKVFLNLMQGPSAQVENAERGKGQ